MNKIKAIGLCGVARCGKDSFYSVAHSYLFDMGYQPLRFSFADALKDDLYSFLKEKTGISSFTDDATEKDLIRDFLVSYGSHLMRKINERYWIEKIEPAVTEQICRGFLPVFTDVRYPNELEWIKNKLQGGIIHISRPTHPPANQEEELHDPLMQKGATVKFKWHDFKGGPPSEFLSRPVLEKLIMLLSQ